MTMPRLDGHSALGQIRALAPDLPVILTTGYDAAQITHGLLADPNVSFLQKPFSPDELVRTVLARLDPRPRSPQSPTDLS